MIIPNTIRAYAAIVFLLLSMAIFPCDLFADLAWKFIVVGDSRSSSASIGNGVNTEILGEMATEIVSQGAEFVLFPGDLVKGYVNQTTLQSQLLTWRDTIQPVYDAGIPIYAVRGNHDVGSPAGVTAWNNIFSGAYALPGNGPAGETNLTYSVEHKNALILGLDEYTPNHQVNQTWVDAKLDANTQPHIFAFGHEPAFAANHADCLDDYPSNRNSFWESLATAGGRTYFAGHDHFYDHARIDDGDGNQDNDLHQYIVGTGGAPLRDWSPPYSGSNAPYTPVREYYAKQYGYVVVEIDNLNATLTWFQRMAPGVYSATAETWSYTAVPEPSTFAGLLGLCLAGLLARARRKC
ncbi:MAG: metallophosphoesterase [Planctomycetota bacterium]|nr:metallophosphoesterase [Planctomycetota bacterium]